MELLGEKESCKQTERRSAIRVKPVRTHYCSYLLLLLFFAFLSVHFQLYVCSLAFLCLATQNTNTALSVRRRTDNLRPDFSLFTFLKS